MKKHALLVGINKYKNYPHYKLYGCVRDTQILKQLLMEKQGYRESEITILLDEQATKQNVVYHTMELVRRAQLGELDYWFQSNSSHGTQSVCGTLEEPDGLDEVTCMYDIDEKGGDWDSNTVIRDNEWYEMFKLVPPNVVIEFLNDSCHSGDSLRAANLFNYDSNPTRSRFIQPPFMLGNIEFNEKLLVMRPIHKKPLDNVILWSGCKSDQTSADACINNNYNGAATYYYCRNYRTDKFRKQVIKAINDDLRLFKYEQEPQLECLPLYQDKRMGEI